MRILEVLTGHDSCGVTELAKRVEMNKSTVYRFLTTLKELGYVRQHESTEEYSITLKLFELGSAVVARTELWQEAERAMNRLAQQTGETTHLATLDDGQLVYLHKIESQHSLRVAMMSRVGHTAPVYCTGLGKVLLAFTDPEVAERIIAETTLHRYTDTTITDRDALKADLEKSRARGYAIDYEEHEVGVRCVAAPVFGSKEKLLAALSVSAPSVRLTDERFPEFAELVMSAASEVSARLGSGAEQQLAQERTGQLPGGSKPERRR